MSARERERLATMLANYFVGFGRRLQASAIEARARCGSLGHIWM
jgi:hypothetical protein